MTTIYAATSMQKMVTRDHKDSGCEITSRIVDAKRLSITATTLEQLLDKLCEAFGYSGTYICVHDEDGSTSRISWNMHEDDNSNPLDSDGCNATWAKGENVWLADYDFTIEKRVVSSVKTAQLKKIKNYQFEF